MDALKFAVGQIWNARNGEARRIGEIKAEERHPIYTTDLNGGTPTVHGIEGRVFSDLLGAHPGDLVSLCAEAPKEGEPARVPGPKELVYDAELFPLMKQVHEICAKNGIQLIARFKLDDDLFCSTLDGRFGLQDQVAIQMLGIH